MGIITWLKILGINTKNHNILIFTMQKLISVYSSHLCLWYNQDIERYNGRYFTLMNSVCYSKANTYMKKNRKSFLPTTAKGQEYTITLQKRNSMPINVFGNIIK